MPSPCQSFPSPFFRPNDSYRFGFNGKEKDGETSTQDYGMRIYNPALGKFLSVDPLARKYAYYSPYQFAGDNPIKYIDLDGLEPANPGTEDGQIMTAGDPSGAPREWFWDGTKWSVILPASEIIEKSKISSGTSMNGLAPVIILFNWIRVIDFLVPGGAIVWGDAHSSQDAPGGKLSTAGGKIVTISQSDLELLGKTANKSKTPENPINTNGSKIKGNCAKVILKPDAATPAVLEEKYPFPSMDGQVPVRSLDTFNGQEVWTTQYSDPQHPIVNLYNTWIVKGGDWVQVNLETNKETGVWNKSTGKVDPLPEAGPKNNGGPSFN